jgi:hypothetical protein
MWPFRAKPLIHANAMDWHLENFSWLVKTFAYGDVFAEARLILPTANFFPTEGENGHALAERLFEAVQIYCGLEHAPVRLAADAGAAPDAGAFGLSMSAQSQAAGYFTVNPEEKMLEIRYAPRLLAEPSTLIAAFAHELGHCLLTLSGKKPPCEEDEHEFLTDLAAVYLGFGVFLANSAFQFQQLQDSVQQGWSYARQGYLPETDIVFATALFIKVKAIDPEPAMKHLKPHLGKSLRQALKMLDQYPNRIAEIRAGDPCLATA